jgi:predicted dehydrogenase
LTPLHTHFSIAEKALLAGTHVYVEKPITETITELNFLFDLARKQGKILCAGFSSLGMPAIRRAKQEILSGKYGSLVSVHCDYMSPWPGTLIPYGDPNHWAYSLKGGVLQNMADHPASVVIDAMEGVKEYKLLTSCHNVLPGGFPDLLHVSLKNDDQIGSFTLSLSQGGAHRQISYYLEKGTIIVDMSRQFGSIVKGRGPQNFVKKVLSGVGIGFDYAFGSVMNIVKVLTGSLQKNPGVTFLIQNFYRSILGGEDLIIDPSTPHHVVTLLEKVWNDVNFSSTIKQV